MNELSLSIEKTMTTKEVAEALGVSVDTVQNACKTLQATSENFPKFRQGQRAVYNEQQVTAIKLELQNHSKVNALSPKTTLEKQLLIQQAMQLQAEMIAELQAEIEAQKQELALQQPKVDTYNRIANATGLKTMQEVAKILKIGSNTLFSVLRDKGVFYRSNGVNLPQEKYIKQGLFEVKEEPYKRDNKDFVYTRVFATAKGLLWLEKQIDTQK
jgi:phage antirepressor YoqD-like protein